MPPYLTVFEMLTWFSTSLQTCPGLDQYAIKKFAEAFEAIPRALAENSGVKANEVISKLYAVHQEGKKNVGFDIEVNSLSCYLLSCSAGLYLIVLQYEVFIDYFKLLEALCCTTQNNNLLELKQLNILFYQQAVQFSIVQWPQVRGEGGY